MTEFRPLTEQQARQILADQPFSRLLGAELTSYRDGEVELSIQVDERHRQQFGFVHGGVMAYLADNALTYAAAFALGSEIVTSGFSIEYVRAATGTGLLTAHARLTSATRTKAVAQCTISLTPEPVADARLCATALGTALRRPGSRPGAGDEADQPGS